MCHQTVRQNPSDQSPAAGHAAAGPARGDAGPDRPEDEADGNRDGDAPGRTQSEGPAAGDPVEEPAPADGLGCGDDGGGKAEPPAEANDGVHGLCFSSTGDFVGFSGPGPGPVPGRPSGDFIHEAAPRPSSAGEAFEGQPDDVGAQSEAAGCPDGDGGHERTNGLSSTHPSGGENGETSGITSPVESPELLIRVDDSQSRVENGALSHPRRLPPACPR